MTTYAFTVRDYRLGAGEAWDLRYVAAGLGAGAYRTARVPVLGRAGAVPVGGDVAGAGLLEYEVWHKSGNPVAAEQAAAALRSAFAAYDGDGLIEATVEQAVGTVVVRGRPLLPVFDTTLAHKGVISALVQFEMLDPLLYSPTPRSVTVSFGGTSGGMVTPMVTPMVTTGSGSSGDGAVWSDGTAPAPWTVALNAGPSGLQSPLLMLDGRRVQIDGDIPPGALVAVDSEDGSVLLDGQPRPWVSFMSEWWQVPPGASTFSVRAAGGSGTATLTWRDAHY